jgi:uncharacterized GH25 family protein
VRLSQHVKCLFFVADVDFAAPVPSAAMTYRLGLTLEIAPLVDPLPLLPGDQLPLEVRFEGVELAGVRTRVEFRSNQGGDSDDTGSVVLDAATDDSGTVLMPIDAPGQYIATVIHDPAGGGSGRTVHRAVLSFSIGDVK